MRRDLDRLVAEACDAELTRVSTLDFDSKGICGHFFGELRKRLPDLDAEEAALLDAAFEGEIARVSHVPCSARSVCETFAGELRAEVARLVGPEAQPVAATSP